MGGIVDDNRISCKEIALTNAVFWAACLYVVIEKWMYGIETRGGCIDSAQKSSK